MKNYFDHIYMFLTIVLILIVSYSGLEVGFLLTSSNSSGIIPHAFLASFLQGCIYIAGKYCIIFSQLVYKEQSIFSLFFEKLILPLLTLLIFEQFEVIYGTGYYFSFYPVLLLVILSDPFNSLKKVFSSTSVIKKLKSDVENSDTVSVSQKLFSYWFQFWALIIIALVVVFRD